MLVIFLNNLEEILNKQNSLRSGHRIFNLDETGTTTVHSPVKIVAPKGIKQLNKCTSGERGVLVTTCAIISATGNCLPPAMVFPRKNFEDRMIYGAPPGTLGLANPSGWMTGQNFLHVLERFIKFSNSSLENPSLLIFDNHESHMTIDVIDTAREAGVTLLTLPPHSSNRMQPLDITCYQPFKAPYNAACDEWMMVNSGHPMTIYDVATCVGKAYVEALTPSNIISGFRKSGIFPFNPNIFTESDFLCSYVTNRPLTTSVSSSINIAQQKVQEPMTIVSDNEIESNNCTNSTQLQNLYQDAHQIKKPTSDSIPLQRFAKGTPQTKETVLNNIPLQLPQEQEILLKVRLNIEPSLNVISSRIESDFQIRLKLQRNFVDTNISIQPDVEQLSTLPLDNKSRPSFKF